MGIAAVGKDHTIQPCGAIVFQQIAVVGIAQRHSARFGGHAGLNRPLGAVIARRKGAVGCIQPHKIAFQKAPCAGDGLHIAGNGYGGRRPCHGRDGLHSGQRLAFARGKGDDQHQRGYQRSNRNADAAAAHAADDRRHALAQVAVGHRCAHGHGHLALADADDGIGIGQPVQIMQPGGYAVIAGHFAVAVTQPCAHPHQRIKPVHRAAHAAHHAPEMIARFPVAQLMRKRQRQILFGQIQRQGDKRLPYARDAAGGDAVGKIDGNPFADAVALAQRIQHIQFLALQRAHAAAAHLGFKLFIPCPQENARTQRDCAPGKQRPAAGQALTHMGGERSHGIAIPRQPFAHGVARVDDALAHLIRHRSRRHIRGQAGAEFIHRRIGQGKRRQQPQRHKRPARIDHPAAQPVAQKGAHGYQQQHQYAAHQRGFQQVVKDRHAAHGSSTFSVPYQ